MGRGTYTLYKYMQKKATPTVNIENTQYFFPRAIGKCNYCSNMQISDFRLQRVHLSVNCA